MAISLSKKKSKLSKRVEVPQELGFFAKFLYRIPTALLLLILVFLWSSTTTIISGNIVHVCVSSRKLNNLYCLSAGTQPNFEIPIPLITNGSINRDIKQVLDHHEAILEYHVSPSIKNEELANAVDHHEVILENPSTSSFKNNKNDEVANVVDHHEPILENPSPNFKNTTNEELANAIDHREVILENPAPNFKKNKNEELENAVKIVEEQLKIHRSWRSDSNQPTCNGRGIYVYELPSKFNKDLMGQCGDMIPWVDFCKHFTNNALGEPIDKLGKGWYSTHQYSLEPIFHSRVLKHPCRVYDENEAKLFYVPYYGGLDVLRWHFKNVSNDVKDSLALELLKWLESQRPWVKNSGKDHVFVLGKISWDFRRNTISPWGTKLLEIDQMQNPIKLLIERHPWQVNDIGVPHPTHFHPHSDDDIINWQIRTISSYRKSLVSFAGAARPNSPENIRSILINQCTTTEDKNCKYMNCSEGGCGQPESLIELFMESEFCLQPPGDSPTRKSVFDSLIAGCIPVLFDPFTAYYQYPWHLPEDYNRYSVFIDQEEVREMKVNVVERLMKIPVKERDDMRRYIVYELLPGLVYGDPNSQLEKFQDAFSVTMNNLLERVTRLE